MPNLNPTEMWQVAIEVDTEGTMEDEAALLIFHIEEMLLKQKIITQSFKITRVSVVDINRIGG